MTVSPTTMIAGPHPDRRRKVEDRAADFIAKERTPGPNRGRTPSQAGQAFLNR